MHPPSLQLAGPASLYEGKELLCIEKYAMTYYLIPNQGGNQTLQSTETVLSRNK
jgi:hypothetical protein